MKRLLLLLTTLGAAAVAACNLTNATFTRDSGLGVRDSGTTSPEPRAVGGLSFPFARRASLSS